MLAVVGSCLEAACKVQILLSLLSLSSASSEAGLSLYLAVTTLSKIKVAQLWHCLRILKNRGKKPLAKFSRESARKRND